MSSFYHLIQKRKKPSAIWNLLFKHRINQDSAAFIQHKIKNIIPDEVLKESIKTIT